MQSDPAIPCPPAEWAPHGALWTAWPADHALWEGTIEDARREVAGMVHALSPHDTVCVLVHGPEARASARACLPDTVRFVQAPYGDIWLRDTGPVFVAHDRAVRFAFNGWGGKYPLPHDPEVADAIGHAAGATLRTYAPVLEGGAVEGDGHGTLITTRECLHNPNRNPAWRNDAAVEAFLAEALGTRHVIWLDRGLANDHTDGHVDNLARFVAPGRVVCQHATGSDDPNADVLADIEATLRRARTADGVALDVISIPSPGRCIDADGAVHPASHMNFVIGNGAVVVPTYPGRPDATEQALTALRALFPSRTVIGSPAVTLLTFGGGAFHCITQQQPKEP